MDRKGFIGLLQDKLIEIQQILKRIDEEEIIRRIDSDLMLSKLRDLYEDTILFADTFAHAGKPGLQKDDSISTPILTEPAEQEPVSIAEREPLTETLPEPRPEPQPERQPEPRPEPDFEPQDEPEFEPENEPDYEPEPVPESVPEPEPLPEIEPEPEIEPKPAAGYQQPETRSEAEIPTKVGPSNQKPETFSAQPYQPTIKPTPPFQKPLIDKPRPSTVQEPLLFQREDSLNEALARQKPLQDVASVLNETPIRDIWSAIAINDRFLFIRELFRNDSESFKTTVTHLNGLQSWEAAQGYLADNFSWSDENPIARNFQNIVRRRFL